MAEAEAAASERASLEEQLQTAQQALTGDCNGYISSITCLTVRHWYDIMTIVMMTTSVVLGQPINSKCGKEHMPRIKAPAGLGESASFSFHSLATCTLLLLA